MSTSDQLQQAFRLIKDGNKTQATAILVPIVRAEPNNADAWWLMANAVSSTDQQRRALEQVLRLRPNDDKARRMLDQIGGGAPPPPQYTPQPDPFAGTAPQSDPFASDPFADDPFAGTGQRAPGYAAPRTAGMPPPIAPQRKGTSPLVIFLAVVGVLAVIACAACFAITGGAAIFGGQIIQQVAGTLTSDPDFQSLMGTLTNITPPASMGSSLPSDVNIRGNIEYGQTVSGDVSSNSSGDAWRFSGGQGDRIVIVAAGRNQTDTTLGLYDPSNRLVFDDDDSGDGTDAQISFTLPASGQYTIVVGTYFGSGGGYELTLRR